jgi:hypothetical protein
MKNGIGLPVRKSFYEQSGSVPLAPSPFFTIDPAKLLRVVENAFQRSYFGCYTQYSNTLSTYVQSILALPEIDEFSLRNKIRDGMQALSSRLGVFGDVECLRCAAGSGPAEPRRNQEASKAVSLSPGD